MSEHYADDVATGEGGPQKLRIIGRPRQGCVEEFVILEEPGEPVLMHYDGKLVPHFKKNCPNCHGEEPKPLWYVGARTLSGMIGILELTQPCFQVIEAASRKIIGKVGDAGIFAGLLVAIRRGDFRNSPRVARCEQRAKVTGDWPYRTREELARIWNVPIRPRLYKEGSA